MASALPLTVSEFSKMLYQTAGGCEPFSIRAVCSNSMHRKKSNKYSGNIRKRSGRQVSNEFVCNKSQGSLLGRWVRVFTLQLPKRRSW